MVDHRETTHSVRIATGLRGEAVGDAVLLLDDANGVVIRLEDRQAAVARCLLDGEAVPSGLADAVDELVGAGLLVEHEDDGAMLRRRFLTGAAVATGIAVFHLPSAAAAASSPGGGGPGGGGGNAAPDAPSIGEATPGDGSATITISQIDNGGGPITNYEYSVDGGGWVPFSPAQTSGPFTVTGLTGPATIRLRAINATGPSAPSAGVSVTPLVLPAAPVVTAASAVSLTSATLTFTQGGSAPVTGYEVSTDGGSTWGPVSTSGGTATVNGLYDGASIRLRAVNGDGESGGSNATAASSGSQTFTSSGTFTVPAGVTLVDLEAYGGAGASGATLSGRAGGLGGQPGKVTGQFTAFPGSTRAVIIGQGAIYGSGGSGDAPGGVGGWEGNISPSPTPGGQGGGGGGTSIKGSGLEVYAGGGGGGGGAATNGNTGVTGSTNTEGGWGTSSGGWGEDGDGGSGGGGAGGGGGGDSITFGGLNNGHPGLAGTSNTRGGKGGGRGASSTVGLTGGATSLASGRTVPAVPTTRSQGGEAIFRWLGLTVS